MAAFAKGLMLKRCHVMLSEVGGIFTIKEEYTTVLRAGLFGQCRIFFSYLVKYCRTSRHSPTESHKL